MNLVDAFLEILYPPRCIICDEPIRDYGYCDDCNGKLEPIKAPLCQMCGLEKGNCACKYNIFHFDAITAPYFNEEYAQQGVYDLKFKIRYNCVRTFGREMAKCVKKDFGTENIDLICCVPARNESLYDRGFNHAELFAREISKQLKIKRDNKLLKLNYQGKTQHRLKTIDDRFNNVRGRYGVTKTVKGKNILLVDDIKTSGATIDECARQLKFAGAEKVYCVTALVTRKKKNEETNAL